MMPQLPQTESLQPPQTILWQPQVMMLQRSPATVAPGDDALVIPQGMLRRPQDTLTILGIDARAIPGIVS